MHFCIGSAQTLYCEGLGLGSSAPTSYCLLSYMNIISVLAELLQLQPCFHRIAERKNVFHPADACYSQILSAAKKGA